MKMRYHVAALAWLALASPAIAAQGSGCLPTTGTVSGLSMTQYINTAIAAVTSSFSGASAPATDCTAAPVKGQTWLDTSVTPNVEKRYDGTNWVVVGAIDSTNHVWAPPVGGGSANVTAASTTDICAAPSALQSVSGTTPITSFGSACAVGVTKKLIFSSATPITYNASSMILPAQRDFTASAGDMADATYLGFGNWRVSVSKIDGSSVTNPAVPLGTISYGMFGTIPPKSVIGARQALARSSYPDYFAAVTRVQSGTITPGNNTITSLSNTRGFGAGMPIEVTGVPIGTYIVSVTSSTIVMTQNASGSGSQSVRVFLTGYGTGGDSTTVGVPDCVGQTLAGLDPTAAQLDGAAGLNSFQGVKSRAISTAQLPFTSFAFAGSAGAVSVQSNVNNIPFEAGNVIFGSGGGATGNLTTAGGYAGKLFSDGTFTPAGGINVNGTGGNSFGSGSAFPTVQPTRIAECVVAVLP